MVANESFFRTPTDRGAVDIETAHETSRSRDTPMGARANTRFFGDEPEEPKPKAKQETAKTSTDPMLMQTLQTLNETVKNQSEMLKNLQQSSDPQAQARAMAQFEDARRRQQEYVQRFNPPDQPDLDDIITDGEALHRYIEQSRDWALQVARAEYGPMAQRMEALETLAAPILDEGRERAWEKAANKLRSRGHSEESVEKMRELANRVGQASYGQDFVQHQRFLMNPDAMAYAAEAAWDQQGNRMPVRGDDPPINAPSQTRAGDRKTSEPGRGAQSLASDVERRLGITFSKDSMRKLDKFMKEGR